MSRIISHKDLRWYAIRTKFRSEKSAVAGLKQLGIEAYVPLLKKVKQYASKRKEYQVPLINCYAFVKVSAEDYRRIYNVHGVFDFVRIAGRLIVIPDSEMELMQRVVGERYGIDARASEFEEGQEVDIIAGSLTGLRGTLVRKSGKKQFVVKLNHIGIDLMMDVPAEMLRSSYKRA